MAENMGIMTTINVAFAGIIAFGVVYNAARISLSERSHDLASLRVLGFTRAEISLILLGELAVLTAVALPFGAVLGVRCRRASSRRSRARSIAFLWSSPPRRSAAPRSSSPSRRPCRASRSGAVSTTSTWSPC